MRRRSDASHGYVNFPINDPTFTNSKEGGMFVRLVVHHNDDWMLCCGGAQHIFYDEELIGTREDVEQETALWNSTKEGEKLVEDLYQHQKLIDDHEERQFPNINREDPRVGTDIGKYLSTEYLAILTLGSTGWSGWNDAGGYHWTCTYEDLTEDGKALYDAVQKLYDGCKLELLTWLDT